jgi:hypothetical protein
VLYKSGYMGLVGCYNAQSSIRRLKACLVWEWVFYHVRYKSVFMGLVVRYMGEWWKVGMGIENENQD